MHPKIYTLMKKILLVLSLLPMVMMAQKYTVSDTLWVNDENDEVARDKATSYGVVHLIDTAANVAVIRYFNKETNRLESVQRVIADGEGAGLEKGKQLFFNPDGKVHAMKVYTVVRDESKGEVRNYIAGETLLYPEGTTKETVEITYKEMKGGWHSRSYERKIYYPDGKLQYEESMGEKGEQSWVYYKPNGKKNMRPKERFPLYVTMPEYPGGQSALFNFLSSNVKYPKVAQQNGIQGRVIVQFVVAKDGSISDVKVARTGGDPSLDKEAVRVIKAMPNWKPGTERGKPVRVKYTVPVNFRLQ